MGARLHELAQDGNLAPVPEDILPLQAAKFQPSPCRCRARGSRKPPAGPAFLATSGKRLVSASSQTLPTTDSESESERRFGLPSTSEQSFWVTFFFTADLRGECRMAPCWERVESERPDSRLVRSTSRHPQAGHAEALSIPGQRSGDAPGCPGGFPRS